MKESFDRIKNGKAEAEGILLDGVLTRLKERDPRGYELLENNLEKLDKNYIQAIIQGSKIEFTDHTGKKITAYEGITIGAGGMGVTSAVAYAIDGGNKIEFAVIKKPHADQKSAFAEETKSAELVQSWESPNINKALHIGDQYIIYETGPNASDLRKAIPKMSPKQCLVSMREVIEGMIYYQKMGYMHGDMKEDNVIVFNGPNGPVTQIIDNTPISAKKAESSYGRTWAATPGYINDFIISKVQSGDKVSYRAIDNFAIGVIMENVAKQSNDPKVKDLAKRCQDPDISSKPGFLESILPEVDALISQSSDVIPAPQPKPIKLNKPNEPNLAMNL